MDKHLEAKLSGAGEAVADLVKGEGGDFDCPQRLVDLCAADTAVAATPCCVCYSTDTVGGNSGSPVLDANGDFVAINFDRQRLGLMNEFKWSAEYSRSIGAERRHSPRRPSDPPHDMSATCPRRHRRAVHPAARRPVRRRAVACRRDGRLRGSDAAVALASGRLGLWRGAERPGGFRKISFVFP